MAAVGFPADYDVETLREELQEEPADHHSHAAVVVAAGIAGIFAYDLMRELGTNGVHLPIRLDAEGRVVCTPRVHGAGEFDTASGKALFLTVGRDTAEAIWDQLEPDTEEGEFWLINGRTEESWQRLYSDPRKQEIMQRWPGNPAEINPAQAQAEAAGVANGNLISLASDRIILSPVPTIPAH